jgi:Flp pilus assembly pilin Flp
MRTHLQKLIARDRGTTLVEYGLLLALIALFAFLALTAFGISVTDLFSTPDLLDALSS